MTIRVIFETALAAMSPALETAWENDQFVPEGDVAYQQANLMLAQPENPSFGRGYRELGIFQVTLKYPYDTGAAAADARAQLLRDTFYRSASFTSGGLTVTVQRTPEISQGRIDGDRWAVPVKIRFFANNFG